MTDAAKPADTEFDVVVDANRAAALATAAGLPADRIPLTYPAMWLFSEPVEALVAAALGPDAVPIHVGQQFRYARPLQTGETYRLKVAIGSAKAADKPVLPIDMSAYDQGGEKVLEGRTTIALHPASAEVAP